jgi:adenylylsulfate kinase
VSGAHRSRTITPGWAIWITGLPGSGKTALARAVARQVARGGERVKVLELDELRKRLTPTPTYSDAERDIVYRALVVMATLLSEAGVHVIVDATAHRRLWRDLARASIPRFAEVHVRCPLDVCRERERRRTAEHSPRGIYASAGRPAATVPGVDVPYEPPVRPELAIDTTITDVETGAAGIADLARRL